MLLIIIVLKLAQQRIAAAESMPGLIHHTSILRYLGLAAASDDESEPESEPEGEHQYRVVGTHWRSDELTSWLRALDEVYNSIRTNRRSVSRIRIPPRPEAPKSNKTPPSGLPRNFFGSDYLNDLPKLELDGLSVRDEVYPLEHADEVIA